MKTKQFGLSRGLACAIILAIPLAAFGRLRLVKGWSYQEMFDQADLVVVAKPVSTTNTTETGRFARYDTRSSMSWELKRNLKYAW